MASQLKVDTITGVTTAGSISVTGEGNSTTTNLQQGLAKVWVNFNGTGTVAIRDSLSVSGLTDNGTGDQTVAFANNMDNDDYSSTGTCLGGSTDGANYSIFGAENASAAVTKTTSVVQCTSGYVSNTSAAAAAINHQEMNLVIHGDLA